MKTLPPRVMVRAASMEYYLDRFNPDGTRRAGPVAPFWWRSEGVERQWCGVFQGGGVKGVAYAGPLSFFAQRRQWFGEVTGSSVGALTATLIASGLHPDELFRATIDLLEQIQPATPLDRLIAALPPSRWFARYESAGLEQALERKLDDAVRRHGVEPAGRVTFSELEAATGIRLTIVVLDTATGHPLPFCPQWSPELSVSTAAVASCSVPVVFPSRFLEVDPLTPGPEWRRLADGGVFANFPSFVYEDPAFRRYYRLGPMPESSKTIGFVFSDPREVTPPVPRRFVTDPRHVLPSGDVISGPAATTSRAGRGWRRRPPSSTRSTSPATSTTSGGRRWSRRTSLPRSRRSRSRSTGS
jgi:predicted acylesterase/phospholipase RssA